MPLKRYRETIQPGGTLEVQHPAECFHLLGAQTEVDVAFCVDSRVSDEAAGMVAGLWFKPRRPFDKVRITNRSEFMQAVTFLVTDGEAGYKTPPPTVDYYGLAPGALNAGEQWISEVIDMGENWACCILQAQLMFAVASAGGLFVIDCATTRYFTDVRHAVGAGWSGTGVQNIASTSVHISSVRPTGRFVRIRIVNGATAQGVGFVCHVGVLRNVTA